MILSYGGYAHEEDEVGFRLSYRTVWDKFRRRMGQIETWDIVGIKQATSQADLTTKLNALETAYLSDFGDIVLKDNDDQDTAHKVDSSATFSGVRVAQFGYPKGPWDMQTEYGAGGDCKRVFHIVLTAETRFGTAADLYAYRERITQIGNGGPKQVFVGSLFGSPQPQVVRQNTVIRFVQEGYVIGRGQVPTAPTPNLQLGAERQDQRVITQSTPEEITVQGAEMYQVNYRYTFERADSPGSIDLSSNTINAFGGP